MVAAGSALDAEQAADAVTALTSGEASPALAAALLTALHIRGETPDEVAGFARRLRDLGVRIAPRRAGLVDTCGTGGGTVPTFNVSTTAAFVVAGAGVPVAKHGNRAMTSACGSADVLEALGARLDLPPERIRECIETVGIGFLFAQAHHPAMRHVGPIRRELPFRTIFNCAAPLTNPAGARRQVVGVYEERLVPLLAGALVSLGCERALVVHGRDGLDECSTLGSTLAAEVRNGVVETYEFVPEDAGVRRARPADIAPGASPAENAAITRAVLGGEAGPRLELVLLNAAAALLVADTVPDLAAGVDRAAAGVRSGAALACLDAFVAFTQS